MIGSDGFGIAPYFAFVAEVNEIIELFLYYFPLPDEGCTKTHKDTDNSSCHADP
jgi:hypothetical protein